MYFFCMQNKFNIYNCNIIRNFRKMIHYDKLMIHSTVQAGNSGRIVVIMLTGQRVEVTCDPQKVTAGDLFQVSFLNQKYSKNFFRIFNNTFIY